VAAEMALGVFDRDARACHNRLMAGKPVAVLLRTEGEEDLERLLMGHSPKLQTILEAARKRFREGAGVPHETFWKDVEAENARKTKKRDRTRKNGRINGGR